MTCDARSEALFGEAAEVVRREHERNAALHAQALACVERASVAVSAAWLRADFGLLPESEALHDILLRPGERDRIRSLRAGSGRVWPRRAASAANDRFALALLAAHHMSGRAHLCHSQMGQPFVALEGGGDREPAKTSGIHISFTHDGDAHVGVSAHSPGLRGIGVDTVCLPRLRAKSQVRGYFTRFAGHFMGEQELAEFRARAVDDLPEELLLRSAAHFSLMEAASKALGTGLLIGAGMGGRSSLPKQSISVIQVTPDVRISATGQAQLRAEVLEASRFEGHWSADEEYLLSLVLLWQ